MAVALLRDVQPASIQASTGGTPGAILRSDESPQSDGVPSEGSKGERSPVGALAIQLTSPDPTSAPQRWHALVERPLRERIDQVRRLGLEADRDTACAIGVDLALCAQLDSAKATYDRMIDNAARARESGSAEALANAMAGAASWGATVERGLRHCDGIDASDISTRWLYLMRAAELGNAHAQLVILMSPPFEAENVGAQLAGLEFLQTRALPLATSSAQRGNAELMYAVLAVDSGAFTFPLGIAPQRDVVRLLAFAQTITAIADPYAAETARRAYADAMRSATPDQLQRAHEWSGKMLKDAFKDVKNFDLATGFMREPWADRCLAHD